MELNIKERLDIILNELDRLKSGSIETVKKEEPYQSEKTEEINTAIAKASLEFPTIKINRQNPYLASGYSDLHEITTKVRPSLSKHDLHITQIKKQIDGRTLLVTRIWHSSGQWIESRVFLTPSKNTIESYGSNLNSMKRFEVMDILGLTVSGDPFDDDGEADMEKEKEVVEKGIQLKELITMKDESYETISVIEYEELMIALDDHEDIVSDILEKLHIQTLRQLPKSRFKPTIDRVRRVIKRRATGS